MYNPRRIAKENPMLFIRKKGLNVVAHNTIAIDATNVEIGGAVQQQNTSNEKLLCLQNQFTTKRADVHATMMDVDMDLVEAPYEHYLQLP